MIEQVQSVGIASCEPHVCLLLPLCPVSASCFLHLLSCYHHSHSPTSEKKKNWAQTLSNSWRQWFCIGYCHVHSFRGGRKNSCSSPIVCSCSAKCRTWSQTRSCAQPIFDSWCSVFHRYQNGFRLSWHLTKKLILLYEGICSTSRCNITGNAGKRSAAWLDNLYQMLQICCPLEVWWLYWRQAAVLILYVALTFL